MKCPLCGQDLGMHRMGLYVKRTTYTCPSSTCDYWWDTVLNPANTLKPVGVA